MKPAAIRATYSDFKLIKTRQVVSLSFEMPLADWNAVGHEVLGMPQPGSEQWFAIAALQANNERTIPEDNPDVTCDDGPSQPAKQAAPAKRSWDELSPTQQAGIRCEEPAFRLFLFETYSQFRDRIHLDTAELVRLRCGVTSRKELNSRPDARTRWLALENRYQEWLAKEQVGI